MLGRAPHFAVIISTGNSNVFSDEPFELREMVCQYC